MKPKHILRLALLLLLVVVVFMVKDFFFSDGPNPENPYEYDLSKLKETDAATLGYKEIASIKPETDYLYGIAIDAKDNLYISCTKNIFVYNSEGELFRNIPLRDNAYCLTIAETGELYLGMADHVEVWDMQASKLQSWESMGESSIFTSIAINGNSVFVADAGNKVVYHFDLNGELQNKIGERDTKNGKLGFILPSAYFDLAIGRDNDLWVVNPGIHQLESYSPEGELITSWKRTSMQLDGFSGCCNPSHIAILSDGSFVTSEKGIERVKIHQPTGDFKTLVSSPEQFIAGTTDLDLAVDSKDRIYVSDPKKGLVRIFEKIDN